jgi:O-antigen ligase
VIAITYPIWTRRKWASKNALEVIGGLIGLLIPILAILGSRSNMALAALLSAFAAPVLGNIKRPTRRQWAGLLVGALILIALGKHFMGSKFGVDSGRFGIWRATMSWWMGKVPPEVMVPPPEHNQLLGTGLGSYFVLGPNVQIRVMHQYSDHLFWMHNDFLQIMFEQGIVGLGLFVLMAIFVFRYAGRSALKSGSGWVHASLAAYAMTCLGNFPMHLPVPAFLGAFLVVYAFRADREDIKAI